MDNLHSIQSKQINQLPSHIQKQIAKLVFVDDLKKQYTEERAQAEFNLHAIMNLFLKTKTPNTCKLYKKALNDYVSYCKQLNKSVLCMKALDCDKYIVHLQSIYKTSTIKTKVACIASFYSALYRYDYVNKNPFHKAKMQKVITEKKTIMNTEEYNAIINTTDNAKLIQACKLMKKHGLRIGALQTIKKTDDGFVYTTKGNKNGFKKEDDKSLLNNCKALQVSTIQKALEKTTKTLCRKNIIRKAFSAHDIRHFYAHELYTNTKDIMFTCKALDHANVSTTQIYLSNIGCLKA